MRYSLERIKEDFKKYRNGTRVMFLIHRNKEGGGTNNTKLKKLISDNEVDWCKNLDLLYGLQKESVEPLRIYASLNARDFDKGVRKFKEMQLDNDYFDQVSHRGFYMDIHNRFISALMRPSSRSGTRFLFDVDCEREQKVLEIELEKAGIETEDVFETPNGWHYITEPFNPALTPLSSSKLSKDGLVLLNWKVEGNYEVEKPSEQA